MRNKITLNLEAFSCAKRWDKGFLKRLGENVSNLESFCSGVSDVAPRFYPRLSSLLEL
jgi:hypothetical protein